MKRIGIIWLCVIWVTTGLYAQDVHYTQQFDNDVYLNPALSGHGQKENRLLVQYRDQWRTVPVPFASAYMSYDRRIAAGKHSWIGLGGQLLFDRQGDGHLSTLNFSISPSFTQWLAEDRLSISVGVEAGLAHRFVDEESLIFESQYNGTDINPVSGEALGGSVTAANVGAGVHVAGYLGDQRHRVEAGFSTYNLTRPDLAFIENATDERPVRYNTYVRSEIFVGGNGWSINPVFQFQRQQKLDNILPMLYAKKYFTSQSDRAMAVSFGAGYRVQDAAEMYFAYEIGDFKFGLSYDLNTSGFNDATNTVGAGEILLKYEWERERKKEFLEVVVDSVFEDTVEVVEEIEETEKDTIEVVEVAPVVPVTPVEPEPEPEPFAPPTEIEMINDGMAISLYFPNDYPDPRSTSPTTKVPYVQIFREYMRQSIEYYRIGGEEGNMVEFIEDYVVREWHRYKDLMREIRGHLRQGRSVTIVVRGYTSPLATSDYNLNLSKRRIQCVINQVRLYDDVEQWYESGKLRVEEAPYGETKADASVSDDRGDKKRSVYSDKASFERRVEIEQIRIE